MPEVISATSFDQRFSAQDIFDSDTSTFWISTGLYPQELIIQLEAPHNLNELKIKSMRSESHHNHQITNFLYAYSQICGRRGMLKKYCFRILRNWQER